MTSDDEVTALFRKEAGHLRGYLIKCGASPETADDCVQDGFLAVARRGECLVNPLAYAYKVARRQLTSAQMGNGRELPTSHTEDTADVTSADLSEDLLRRQEEDEVREALDRLPPGRSKEAVTLRFLHGFSVAEAAAIMGVSTGAIKRYTHDGLFGIRSILEGPHGEGEGQ